MRPAAAILLRDNTPRLVRPVLRDPIHRRALTLLRAAIARRVPIPPRVVTALLAPAAEAADRGAVVVELLVVVEVARMVAVVAVAIITDS